MTADMRQIMAYVAKGTDLKPGDLVCFTKHYSGPEYLVVGDVLHVYISRFPDKPIAYAKDDAGNKYELFFIFDK